MKLELKRGVHRVRIQSEIYRLAVSQLKIWSFHVVVVPGRQRNVHKSVVQVQSFCFAHLSYCFFDVLVAVAVVVSYGPFRSFDRADG